jgi:hypothetical protein
VERRDAQVGLVDPVGPHGLFVGQARERRGNRVARHLGQAHHQRFHHLEDALLLRKGHLQVDLGELRLPVGAEVFVAEATHDLEVLLKSADHEQLLEDLRRLRQRVELPALHAARHQEVARAFRSTAGEERCFDFQEPQ